ncbi:MAG: hypothetical protein QXT19_03410 [Candidatus Woesearchaeota archaeon]
MSRFEGWLKAELVDVLVGKGFDAVPETNTIDVVCRPQEAAIELKTINTNYLCEGTKFKRKRITQNVKEVVNDIKKLENTHYRTKMVVFVAYPLVHKHPEWQELHLSRIAKHLAMLNYTEFAFKNNIPGVLYIGQPTFGV